MKVTVVWSLNKFNETGSGGVKEMEREAPTEAEIVLAEREGTERDQAVAQARYELRCGIGDVERIQTRPARPVWYTRCGNRFEVKEMSA